MNRFKRMVAALAFGLAFGGLQAATVENIKTVTHYPWNGKVDVTYTVKGVETESQYALTAIVRAGDDYDALATNVTVSGTYSFTWDAAAAGFAGRVEDAQVIFTFAEPKYAVVDLSAGATTNRYPVTYLAVADVQDEEYKTEKLLLKRVGKKYVGVFEVTQKQYELVMGTNPSYFNGYSDKAVEAKRPVERVSYEVLTESSGFFDRLATRTGLPFALPTGEEWDAAARGAMPDDKAYNLGAKGYWTLTNKAGDNTWLPSMGRYIDLWNGGKKTANGNNNAGQNSNATKGTAIVGSYEANDNGLYDVHGNVAEWTSETDGEGHYILRGGSWQDGAEECAVTAKWTYLGADVNQLYKAGFRVFGDQTSDKFIHEETFPSAAFALDVDSDNIRQIRVEDNAGAYTFYYTPEGGSEIDWVTFDDPATVGGKDWKPTQKGLNEAKNLTTGEKAKFYVEALTMTWDAKNVTVTYDGGKHTITGPTVTVPSAKYDVVYWCADAQDQSAEDEATSDPIYFTDVKYDGGGSVTTYEIFFKVTSAFYDTVTSSRTLKIKPLTVKDATVVTAGDEQVYTGYELTNKVTSVTVVGGAGTLTLEEGRDYEVFNNFGTDAGEYTLTIGGTGNFCGEKTKKWKILPFDLGGGDVTINLASDSLTYPGTDYESGKYVYTGDTILNEVLSAAVGKTPVSFDVVVGSNTGKDVGEYTVAINGKGNFQGTATKKWYIQKRDIGPTGWANTVITLGDALTYNGDVQTQLVASVVTDQGALSADEYEVTENTGTDATAKHGAYGLKVTVKDASKNFRGEAAKEWSIAQKALTDDMFTLTPDTFVYTGKGQEPAVSAEDLSPKGVNAIAAEDWSHRYENNTNVTTEASKAWAKMTAADDGNYKGTAAVSFEITPAEITSVTVKPAYKSFDYDGQPKTITEEEVTVMAGDLELKSEEYKVVGDTSKTDAGTYTVSAEPVVVGDNAAANFKNATTAASDTWEIRRLDIGDAIIDVTEPTYSGQLEKLTIVSVTKNGLPVDYDVVSGDEATTVVDGPYTLTLKGKGNFEGTFTKPWNVQQLDISAATLTTTYNDSDKIPTYNGSEYANATTSMTVNHPTRGNITLNNSAAGWTYVNDKKTDAGDYTMSTVGTGNLTGSKDAGWKIARLVLSDANTEITIADQTFDKTPKQPTVTKVVVKDAAKGGTDLDITSLSSWNAVVQEGTDKGKYDVTVTGSVNFDGSAKTQWEMKARSLTDATVTLDKPVQEFGSAVPVQATSIVADGVEVFGCKTITTTGNDATEPGRHTVTFTGSDNLADSVTATYDIRPNAPVIKPGENGSYSKLCEYITVNIERGDDSWEVYYTTDGSEPNETSKLYPLKDGKFDIDKRTTVKARARARVGESGEWVWSTVATMEYYFGRAIAPTIGLYNDWATLPTDAAEKGAAKLLIVKGTEDTLYTNFYHNAARVNLTRFGLMTEEEIVAKTNETTVVLKDVPVCPYTDGEIWYTVATDGASVVNPTNAEDGVSRKFVADDQATWPCISNDVTIVARAFGDQMDDSELVTNRFYRIREQLLVPVIKLRNPDGTLTNEFRHTGATVFVTNNESVVEHEAVAWPAGAKIKIALGEQPTDFFLWEDGKTCFTNDTETVWAVVECNDYVSTTSKVDFVRRLDPISAPTINLANNDTRTNVVMSFDIPAGANKVYYTYAVMDATNTAASADWPVDPIGDEYDKTQQTGMVWTASSSAVVVNVGSHKKLVAKAIAYFEDGETAPILGTKCFTARSSVTTNSFGREWKIEDALDVPDWEGVPFTVSDSIAKPAPTTNCVEDTEVEGCFGGSAMKFRGLVDNESVRLSTTVIGPGTVIFNWKTLCEKGQHDYNYDHMTFYVNNTPVARLDGDSGGWQTVTNRINGAVDTANVLVWEYSKDPSEFGQEDAAWLDRFQWTEANTQLGITEDLVDWIKWYDEEWYETTGKDFDEDDWADMLALTAANNRRTYWECYVLGIDPTDPEDDLYISAPTFTNYDGGLLRVSFTFEPQMAGRTYTLVGKKTLGDENWATMKTLAADADADTGEISATSPTVDGYHIFRLRIRMTQDVK